MRDLAITLRVLLGLILLLAASGLRAASSAEIGDRVWQDLNGDGLQDAGEPGMSQVTLRLQDCAGNVLATTTSGSNGEYSFLNLVPGQYAIEVLPPSGFVLSPSFRGNSRILDSNPKPNTGLTGCMSMADGQYRPGIDAGLAADNAPPSGQIGDRIWEDLNADGLQDAGEPGLPQVTVRLQDCEGNVLTSTTSGADGSYAFTGLAPGDYVIEVVPSPGHELSPHFRGDSRILDSNPKPDTGLTGCMSMADGQSRSGIDAGLAADNAPPSGQIGDRIWEDLNADGLQDAGELGLPEVTVRLQDCAGNLLTSTTSGADGSYAFTGLAPGGYVIEVVPSPGYDLSPHFRGDSRTVDSNPNPNTGLTGCMGIAERQSRSGIDAGLTTLAPPGSGQIGDLIWEDLNADGVQDAGEPGMPQVTVRLQDCAGNVLLSTTSAADGRYSFPNLVPDDYVIEVIPPTGYLLSPSFRGPSRALDSNPKPDTFLTGCMSVAEGQSRPGIDAGIIAQSVPAEPSVLFVVIDDLNDFVGVLGGHPQANTPNIDALAAQGIQFSNAHVAGPSCNAARSSFLTGISPARSGITANTAVAGALRDNLPDAVSLVRAFGDAGYYTARYGKIFHGFQEHDEWDISTGSSEAVPAAEDIPLNGMDFSDALPFAWQWDWGPIAVEDSEMADHANTDKAISFINTWAGNQPFFVSVALTATHLPWYCPSSSYDLIAGGNTQNIVLPTVAPDDLNDVGTIANGWAAPDIWSRIPAAGQHQSAIHAYLACGAFLDQQLGRLLAALDASPFGDNTIVVLLSDHGFHVGEKGAWNKFMLWEEDTRVPFMMRLPSGTVANPVQQIELPVNVSALYPTLLELTGIASPSYPPGDPLYRIDYRSLLPLIDAGGVGWQGSAVSFNYTDNVSIRTSTHRFTLYRNGFVELYDHSIDPDEWNNVAGLPENQQLVSELSAQAQQLLSGQHDPL